MGGKVLEKNTYKHNYAIPLHQQPNESKPKKNATDAAPAVKKIYRRGTERKTHHNIC